MMEKTSFLVGVIIIVILLSCNNENNFSLCALGLRKPYYFTNVEYQGGLYAIKKIFALRYTPIKNGINNGIVKIRFDINCHGEAGNFVYETYNFDYKLTVIDQQITHQLLEITKLLDKWQAGYNDEGETVNSFKFLAFRIKDGEIREILPR